MMTKLAVLCIALQASCASAFVAHAPSRPVRIAKSPIVMASPGFKLAPSLRLRPRFDRRAATKVQSSADGSGPLSPDDKRMFVRWCYVMCLANSLVNSATLIQFEEVVMHMTGPSTKGPLFLASGLAASGWHNLATIAAFLVGCMFAGLATAHRDGDTPIAATAPTILYAGLLLMISGIMAKNNVHSCLYFAACAGGMLNGLTSKMTTYRVSHVTGTVTDMGLLIGKKVGMGAALEPALGLKLRDLTILMGLWFVGGCTAFWMSATMTVGKVMSLSSIPVILLGLKARNHGKPPPAPQMATPSQTPPPPPPGPPQVPNTW